MMRMHQRLFSCLVFTALLAPCVFAQSQFTSSAADVLPSELGPAMQGVLNSSGTKIMTQQGATILEIWFRSSLPAGSPSKEGHVTLPTIPKGSLVGAMRVSGPATDARGQALAPGVYTLRYGVAPDNEGHKTVAPQRDFMLISRAADDLKSDTITDMDALIKQSAKASGTPHAAVYSLWKAGSDFPGFTYENEADWVLQSKIGNVPICTTVVWKE
jgi:hypothetical protein